MGKTVEQSNKEQADAISVNMGIWTRNAKTNARDAKKAQVRGGHRLTAIKPHSQIEAATREFGPVGLGWGWSVEWGERKHGDDPYNHFVVAHVTIWYDPARSLEATHWTDGKIKRNAATIGDFPSVYAVGTACVATGKSGAIDKDAEKKAVTDGITKALSALGFNADIFSGLWDDSSYVAEREAADRAEPARDQGAESTAQPPETGQGATNASTDGSGQAETIAKPFTDADAPKDSECNVRARVWQAVKDPSHLTRPTLLFGVNDLMQCVTGRAQLCNVHLKAKAGKDDLALEDVAKPHLVNLFNKSQKIFRLLCQVRRKTKDAQEYNTAVEYWAEPLDGDLLSIDVGELEVAINDKYPEIF